MKDKSVKWKVLYYIQLDVVVQFYKAEVQVHWYQNRTRHFEHINSGNSLSIIIIVDHFICEYFFTIYKTPRGVHKDIFAKP